MVYKFENPEPELTAEDPKMVLMESWAQFSGLYREHAGEIHDILTEADRAAGQGALQGVIDFPIQAQARLQERLPELVSAVDGLRNALDAVEGWQIAWRLRAQGELIAWKETELSEDVAVETSRRAPGEFGLIKGRILSSSVGAGYLLKDVAAVIEVGLVPDSKIGIEFQLSQMFEIQLDPLDNEY